MKVFVTGGSGFIGGHIIEQLSKKHSVGAMARSDKSAATVKGFGALPVRCDLSDLRTEHLAGYDAVIHCAAFVEEWGSRAQFWEANVEGTTRILEAARAAGVSRFVHIGTEAALFSGQDLLNVDESQPYPTEHRYLYSETKAEAERRVLAANQAGFATLSIRPRFVWGPRDTSVLPAVLRMAQGGGWAWIGGGTPLTSTTHVLNLVHAVDLALQRGTPGQAYFVADEGTRTIKEFLTALTQTQGVNLPERNLPRGLARALAALVEGTWRLFGLRRAPPMTRFAIDMMSSSITVRTEKAQREFGYSPILSVADGMRALSAR
jgi:hypothetical protein